MVYRLVIASIAFHFCTSLSYGQTLDAAAIKVKAPPLEKISPFMMLYDPAQNNILLENQKIDYDLTKEDSLRMGPYFLGPQDISLHMTKEQGEIYEIDFGIESQRRVVPLYVLSFRWPLDYVDSGLLEIIDDKNQVIWKRKVNEKDIAEWQDLVHGKKKSAADDEIKEKSKKDKSEKAKSEKKYAISRPEQLSRVHTRSAFGLAHTGFFEIPIAQIKTPFRFCITKNSDAGRLALCSRRYQFYREFGSYVTRSVSKEVRPRVNVNDKPVTLKGTAIFLDYSVPIKFSALLKNGTYYEFVANPKEIKVVDLIENRDNTHMEIIGYGDTPMGPIDERFYADTVHWGLLNFMPTIGDLRRFWRIQTPMEAPYLYLRGNGGAPFRQNFIFDKLPSKKARLVLDDTIQRTTYSDVAILTGTVDPSVQLSAPETRIERISPTEFEWDFLAPNKGELNRGYIVVEEDGHKFKSHFELFRGRATELSGRLQSTVTNDFDIVLMGEVALQHWFEKVLGWENYSLSKLRWGLAARHSMTMAKKVSDDTSFDDLTVTNIDLKYRFTPGIWGRDPSVGLLFSGQMAEYTFWRTEDLRLTSKANMVGGGLFWARSMPKIFDDLFNLVPVLRYPKWVDAEAIFYPLALDQGITAGYSLAFNFHGKVQWTPSFFGEAGFGLKNYSWTDSKVGLTNPTTGEIVGSDIQFAVAYGTFGIGYNF